jgi:stearoyl-CoA desaturase (Delta-9 desaturase)
MPEVGFLAHPWWAPVLFVLIVGHVSSAATTLYLHRSATHGGVKFHPVAEHFLRFWLWLTTGMKTREWVAVHRKHHAFSDREGDPHSPAVEGFWEIVLGGVFFYRRAVKDEGMLEKYGKGCPDDWIERRLYSRYSWAGLAVMFVLDVYLFGPLIALLVWSAMTVWLPIFGNIVNGVGHALGYRNFPTKDESRNIVPLGIFIGGEELHNNHHADPRSARFRVHWFEFDVGWIYIRLLSALRLARVVYARTASAKEFAARHYATATRRASEAASRASEAASTVSARASAAASRASAAAAARASAAAARASAAASRASAAASARVHSAADVAAARVQSAADAAAARVHSAADAAAAAAERAAGSEPARATS